MKMIRLKNPDSTIFIKGETIGAHNITLEKYEELILIAPSHADLFVIEEEAKETPKAVKKPTE